MNHPPPRNRRKIPFVTRFPFSKTRLRQAIDELVACGAKQVEVTDTHSVGLHAVLYPSGRGCFYADYNFQKQARRKRLGAIDVISVDEARAANREVRRMIEQCVDPAAPKLPLLTYSQLFHERYVPLARARKKRSLHTDLGRHANHLAPLIGDVPLDQLTPDRVSALYLGLQEKGLSPTTINRVIEQLKASLNLAVELELIARNPAAFLKRLPKKAPRTDFMTPSQFSAFLRAARSDESLQASRFLQLVALTGCRLGEALNAKWAHIDLEAQSWHLPTQKSGKPGVIYLSMTAVDVLQQLASSKINEYVFPSTDGSKQMARPIRAFRRICKRAALVDEAGKPRYRIHDLRHAWCSVAVVAGVPLEVVSQGARHSSPVITRIYSHPHKEALIAASEAVAAAA